MKSTIANGGISAGNLLIKYHRLLLKHKDQWSGFVTSVAMRYGSSKGSLAIISDKYLLNTIIL